jgi:hypothetical protein
MVINSIEELFDMFADRVADRIAARDPSLVDQHDPRGLRGRRHIDAVRRRMADERKDPTAPKTAFQKGREYLLTPAAVRDELERMSRGALSAHVPPERPRKTSKASAKAAESAELATLKRELESEMVAARRAVSR